MLVAGVALGVVVSVAASQGDQTTLTQTLNGFIAGSGSGETYTGGKGVLVRTPDGIAGPTVLPATFWSNDIVAPSQFYPEAGDPFCPHGSTDGWASLDWVDCGDAGSGGPWDFAVVGYVIGTSLPNLFYDFDNIQSETWGWGVFYPADSNSVDGRCFYSADYQGYDCPGGWQNLDGSFVSDPDKKGSGYRPAGNPDANSNWGGGSGCHFDRGTSRIDQVDAYDSGGNNLVEDYNCQCNYAFKTSANGWYDWVSTWVAGCQQKSGFEWRGWFGGGLAPSWGGDTAACWVNSIRDMISLQNALYYSRYDWNNQMAPISNWGTDSANDRRYWGWNEVPLDASFLENPLNWDAVIIKLPGDLCGNGGGGYDTIDCLSSAAQYGVEGRLSYFKVNGLLVTGADSATTRPGSAIVFVREYRGTKKHDYDVWQRYFFCSSWTSPSNYYTIGFDGSGHCIVSDAQK